MAVTDPLVGSVLDGRYRVDAPLARGGMSTVYAGTDLRLDRRVAVKVMAPALAHDPAFIERFVREARTAARLSHPNAVAVFDQGEHDGGRVFLVMELVAGGTLRDVLRHRGRLRPDAAVTVLEPMLAALAAAHRAGLVHRDVKPENVLVCRDGVVKVVDFGLARAVARPAATTRPTRCSARWPTSPRAGGRGAPPTSRTDVYSAGIVLYEMLTGTRPVRRRHPDRGGLPARARRRAAALEPACPGSRRAGRAGAAGDPAGPGARPADAGAFLAELAMVRSDLGLRRVPVPPRPVDPSAAEDPASTGDDGNERRHRPRRRHRPHDRPRGDLADRSRSPPPPAPTPTADLAPTVASAAARPAAAAIPPPPTGPATRRPFGAARRRRGGLVRDVRRRR